MKVSLLAVALCAFAGSAMGGNPVVSQPPDIGGGGFFSDGVPGQFYDQLIGDNFTLGSATGVSGITWWGGSEFFDFPDLTNMQSFQLQIYADAGGLPGASLLSLSVATALTNPTIVGVGINGENVYRQEVSFGTLNLGPGNYHLSIGATLVNGFGDAWVWNSSVAGFGDSFSARFNPDSTGPWQNVAGLGDLAFEINAIPAPGAASMLGLAGIAALRRRR
jgi:hypothetical protein